MIYNDIRYNWTEVGNSIMDNFQGLNERIDALHEEVIRNDTNNLDFINHLQADINYLKTDIDSFNIKGDTNGVVELSSDLSELQNTVSLLKENLESLKQKVDLEILNKEIRKKQNPKNFSMLNISDIEEWYNKFLEEFYNEE